jgi:hypothetical protein
MVKRLKDQTGDKQPANLYQEGKKNKPDISISKSSYDAFQFTKAEINKGRGKEDQQDESEFPHIEEIIHKHPRRKAFAGVLRKGRRLEPLEKPSTI